MGGDPFSRSPGIRRVTRCETTGRAQRTPVHQHHPPARTLTGSSPPRQRRCPPGGADRTHWTVTSAAPSAGLTPRRGSTAASCVPACASEGSCAATPAPATPSAATAPDSNPIVHRLRRRQPRQGDHRLPGSETKELREGHPPLNPTTSARRPPHSQSTDPSEVAHLRGAAGGIPAHLPDQPSGVQPRAHSPSWRPLILSQAHTRLSATADPQDPYPSGTAAPISTERTHAPGALMSSVPCRAGPTKYTVPSPAASATSSTSSSSRIPAEVSRSAR